MVKSRGVNSSSGGDNVPAQLRGDNVSSIRVAGCVDATVSDSARAISLFTRVMAALQPRADLEN